MQQATLPANWAETGPAVQFALRIMRPLVRIFLRFGVTCDALTAIVRWLYVEVASENREFHLKVKVSKSRVACITGLSRRAVDEIVQSGSPEAMIGQKKGNRAARVLNGWLNDKRFIDSTGKPVSIPLRASRGVSFFQLSKEYSDDVPMRTILDELIAAGSVKVSDNIVHVISNAFVPAPENSEKMLEVTGISLADMATNVEHNLRLDITDRFLQRECYDANIPEVNYGPLKKKLVNEGIKFNEKCYKLIIDAAEAKPKPRSTYRRVGIGVYYFENPGAA
ncbi:MAG: DUF6502 family protein [Gammaproteobacteria bacterium]